MGDRGGWLGRSRDDGLTAEKHANPWCVCRAGSVYLLEPDRGLVRPVLDESILVQFSAQWLL